MPAKEFKFSQWGRLIILLLAAPHFSNAIAKDFKDFFPTEYPEIEGKGITSGSTTDDEGDLKDDLKKLGHELKSSVGYFAKRRTSTCIGAPCKIQVFPLAYTSRLSGFWGGVRTSIIDITSNDPYRLKLSGMFVRSDSREWLSFATIDIPKVPFIFTEARIKARTDYSFSTEFQYYGMGGEWRENLREERARYSLNQKDLYATIIFPLSGRTEPIQFGLLAAYSIENFKTDNFRNRDDTLLFEEKPEGYRGGISQSYSVGFIVDSRDDEIIPRKGQMFEISFQHGYDKNNTHNRLTLVDRRYYSRRKWTLAHRLTLDGFFGAPPFWRLRSVAGADPVLDLNGSGLLIGVRKGRYHDSFKALESLEPRVRLKAFRFMGQLGEGTFVPLAATVGQFGPQFAWSLYSGLSVWWNRSLQLQVYYARAMDRNSLNLLFEHEF